MWWYGVLPTMGIICGCVAAPSVINYYLQKFFQNGNPYRRDLTQRGNLDLYWRDVRLTGSPYVMAGLSNIPDEDGGSAFDDHLGGNQKNINDPYDPSWHTTPCPKDD